MAVTAFDVFRLDSVGGGERAKAEVIETTFFADEALVEGHATYFLKSIVRVV